MEFLGGCLDVVLHVAASCVAGMRFAVCLWMHTCLHYACLESAASALPPRYLGILVWVRNLEEGLQDGYAGGQIWPVSPSRKLDLVIENQ